MRWQRRFSWWALSLLLLSVAAHSQSQNVEMRVMVMWAGGQRLGNPDGGSTPGMPGATEAKSGGGAERISGNSISNMDIRVILLSEDGATVGERSPDGEGTVKFIVTGSVTNPATGAKVFPVYRLRVRGSTIEEQFIDNLQPGLADRMVTVELRRKGEKGKPGGGLVSAATLKIPRKAEKEFRKGQKALEKNKLSLARESFARAVTVYPKYDSALNSLGVVQMRLGDIAGGKKSFEQAIGANDKYAPAYLNLARLNGVEKRYDEAANYLKRSLTLEPLNPEALSLLCQYDVLLHKYDEVPPLAQRLHSVPHDGQALGHFAAGTALEQTGHPTEAIFEYMLFMKEDPTSKLSPAATAAVDRLRQQQNQANAR